MSETKKVVIPKGTVKKLKNIAGKFKKLNTGAVGDEFWIGTGGGGGYDWEQFDIGVSKDKKLITCAQGGCSCNGPEEPTPDTLYDLDGEIELEDGYGGEVSEAVEDLEKTTDTLYRVLNNKSVDPKEIIGLPNAEIRRAVIEIVGYEKLTENAVITDESDVDGTLMVIKLPEDENLNLLHVKDPSTAREYFLRVPPKIKTAKEARAWTFGFETEDFNPIKET